MARFARTFHKRFAGIWYYYGDGEAAGIPVHRVQYAYRITLGVLKHTAAGKMRHYEGGDGYEQR